MSIVLFFVVFIIVLNIIPKLFRGRVHGSAKNTNINLRPPIKETRTKISRRYNISLPADFELNKEFQQAFNLVEDSNDCLFITGKAGTGKSTLLQYFREKTKKKAVFLAPTGVAAVNISGQTIHSFFRFPPRFIQKENIRRRRNRELIKKIDTVVIDEVSMLRADLMDGIDYVLRINRDEMKIPFGGVQIIFFGDLYQLPPVVDPGMKEVFDRKYRSPYFFSADVFNELNLKLKYLELTKVYRQSDNEFIRLLNKIRNKECIEEDLNYLNQRVNKGIIDEDSHHYVTLTTTNNGANAINGHRLEKLPGRVYQYQASVFGEFDESSYPTEFSLKLKEGTQIMLIKNDPDKRWVNGTIGEIKDLADNHIKVSIDSNIYEIPKARWDKIRYFYNEKEQKIEEEVIGSFEQYPIKLAWAITIHKSQGQNFDDVVIDLEDGAFAHGQAYVALSRCTKLEGIRLKKPIIYRDIILDDRIYEFREKFVKIEIDYVIKDCLSCGQKLKFPNKRLVVTCPKCKYVFTHIP